MQKFFLSLLLLTALSCPSFSYGLGPRAIAMGGAYTALANDITAAYWNPAGLVNSTMNWDAMLGEGIDGNFGMEMVPALLQPNQLVKDYWFKDASLNGSVNGIVGGSIGKIGISYIPWGAVSFSKNAANTFVNYDGDLRRSTAVTFGNFISLPYFSSPVAVGANIRSVYGELRKIRFDNTGAPPFLRISYATGQGIGLDLGAQTNLSSDTKVGLAFRNVLTGFTMSGKTDVYADYNASTGDPVTHTATEDFNAVDASPMHVVLGVAKDIPELALISMDIEYADPYIDLHAGIEKAIIPNLIALRMGYYTENISSTSKLTYGFGFDFGTVKADLAFGQDSKNAQDKIVVFSISGGA